MARLIVSSVLDRSTAPPDSVLAAQANEQRQRLTRYRKLVAAVAPDKLYLIDRQLRRLA